MLYSAFEMSKSALAPWRQAAEWGAEFWRHPYNPATPSWLGRNSAASFDLVESLTRRYHKPKWDLDHIIINDVNVPVSIERVVEKDFGALLKFVRDPKQLKKAGKTKPEPRVLIVAPMSGHFATLLRGTVLAMLPDHDVYITDWADARTVPLSAGRFDLNDFVDYLIAFMRHVGPGAHTMAVCQPGPALLAAVAVMSANNDPALPATMTFMGSPIDARQSPTETNKLAEKRDFNWFRKNMIMTVPAPYAGVMRQVYPGFVQLYSFMSMNQERHVAAHQDYFGHLVEGDGDSAAKHRKFYDEYLAVCDMTSEFYLQTIQDVFQDYKLATGKMMHHEQLVDPGLIKKTALMTVEGELDDISGIGQTQAAHDLCSGLPAKMKIDHVQPKVGHYGVFNGGRWRNEIQPKVAKFIRANFDPKKEVASRKKSK